MLGSLGARAGATLAEIAPYLPDGPYWPITRTAILVLFIALTLIAILLLYGGNLQNSNIGPITLRSRGNAHDTLFQAPRKIVTPALETKTIKCSFHFKYVDRRGRPRVARLGKTMKFKLDALNKRLAWARADIFGFWNQRHGESIHTTFVESGVPFAPADTHLFVHHPPSDDTLKAMIAEEGEIVGVSQGIWNSLADSHRDIIRKRLREFQRMQRRRRDRPNFETTRAYLELPDFDQAANIYVRFHFSANPLSHPDPQVKTTAWLTVLTSMFALLTQWLYVGF
jgi:hypothetical protein